MMRNPIRYWLEVVVYFFGKPRKSSPKPSVAGRCPVGHILTSPFKEGKPHCGACIHRQSSTED